MDFTQICVSIIFPQFSSYTLWWSYEFGDSTTARTSCKQSNVQS